MSQQIKLPFKVQMDASISQLLLGQTPKVNVNKQLPIAINRLYKQKMRMYFRKIKNRQVSNSVQGLFSQLVQSVKVNKKQQKVSYLHYAVQQLPTQRQVPRTITFNLRVKSLKQSVFLRIRHYSLQTKHRQLTTILINRQSQLLSYIVPKIQQKILSYGLRKIVEYSKQQKGRFMIIKLIDKFSKLMIKRVGFSEFFNRVKRVRDRENKLKLGVKKVCKIFRLCTRLFLSQTFRQLQLYTQGNRLQQAISQKKLLISQVYTKNTQRSTLVQQQREALRNLKYKLDQQAVERSHVLTERKRNLVLMKTKFNQQSKVLENEMSVAGGEVVRLERIVEKQGAVVSILQGIREAVNEGIERGISYEQTVMSLYKQLTELYQQDPVDDHIPSTTPQFYQQIKQIVNTTLKPQQQPQQISKPTLQSISSTRDYQCMRIELLEVIVRGIEVSRGRQQLQNSPIGVKQGVYSQQYVPTGKSLQQSKFTAGGANMNSASTVLMNTNSSINTSRVSGSASTNRINKSLFSPPSYTPCSQPIQFTKAKQQRLLIEETISLVLRKRYELQMRQAIKRQLQQLSELLVEDSKEE